MATPRSTPESPPPGRRLKAQAYRLLPLGLLGRMMPRAVLGLHYHVVSERDLPHVRNLYPYKTPAQFERDLEYLRRGFRLLSYQDLEAERTRGDHAGVSGRPGVFVSFDDGYRECFTDARPLLLRHGVPCTFFVTTGWLDNRRMFYRNRVSLCLDRLDDAPAAAVDAAVRRLRGEGVEDVVGLRNWLRALDREDARLDLVCGELGADPERYLREHRPYLTTGEIRALHADGFTIGAHTVTHPVLGNLDDWAAIRSEIVESCRAVRDVTGAARVPFAFPVNGAGVSRDRLADLRREHPEIGLMFDAGRLKRDREFIVHRIPAERPGPLSGDRSNLPYHLRRAYVNQGASMLRALFRQGRGK